MNLGFHHLPASQAENRAFLAEGVRGVRCLQSCALEELVGAGALSTDQLEAIESIKRVAERAGQKFGTVELYANGAINIFLKNPDTGTVEGMARAR